MKSIILQLFTDLKNGFKILFKSNRNNDNVTIREYIHNEIEKEEINNEYIDLLTLKKSGQLNFNFININKDYDILKLNVSKISILQNRIFNNNYIHYGIDFFNSDIWYNFKLKNRKYGSFGKKYQTLENAIFFDGIFELIHLKNELQLNTYFLNFIKKISLIKKIFLINKKIKSELLDLYIQNNNNINNINIKKNNIIILFLFTLDFLFKTKGYNELFLNLKNKNALSFKLFPIILDYYYKNTINFFQSLIFYNMNYYNYHNILEYIKFNYISEKNILNSIESDVNISNK